jgi:hypothetical protein
MNQQTTTATEPANLLDTLPSPAAIQDRLRDLGREERLLRRLMPIALRRQDEREQQAARPPAATGKRDKAERD